MQLKAQLRFDIFCSRYVYCDECGNINTHHNVVTRELWLSFKRISAFLSFRETIFRVPWGRNALVTPSNTQHNQLLISSGNLLYHHLYHIVFLVARPNIICARPFYYSAAQSRQRGILCKVCHPEHRSKTVTTTVVGRQRRH